MEKSLKYEDRYYSGILHFLNEKESRCIYFVPTIIDKFNKKSLEKIYINSKEQILYKHDFLILSDYFTALINLFKLRLDLKDFYFRDFNITSIVHNEFRLKRFNHSSFWGLLNYLFIRRLKKMCK